MNLIKEIKFNEPRDATLSVDRNSLNISGVSFEDYHDQDCCENVYADWDYAKDYQKQVKAFGKLSKIEVKGTKN